MPPYIWPVAGVWSLKTRLGGFLTQTRPLKIFLFLPKADYMIYYTILLTAGVNCYNDIVLFHGLGGSNGSSYREQCCEWCKHAAVRALPTSLFPCGSNGKIWPICTTCQPDLSWLWGQERLHTFGAAIVGLNTNFRLNKEKEWGVIHSQHFGEYTQPMCLQIPAFSDDFVHTNRHIWWDKCDFPSHLKKKKKSN